ncbi:hypothetical protein D3C73_1500870 [compost metagenome]
MAGFISGSLRIPQLARLATPLNQISLCAILIVSAADSCFWLAALILPAAMVAISRSPQRVMVWK